MDTPDIFTILEAEENAVCSLLEATRAKQDAIISNDIKALKECTASESRALAALREADRAFVMLSEGSGTEGADEKTAWSSVIRGLSREDMEKADSWRKKIQNLLQEARGLNTTNQSLLQVELDHLDFVSKLLLEESADYTRAGNKKKVDSGTRLVDIKI